MSARSVSLRDAAANNGYCHLLIELDSLAGRHRGNGERGGRPRRWLLSPISGCFSVTARGFRWVPGVPGTAGRAPPSSTRTNRDGHRTLNRPRSGDPAVCRRVVGSAGSRVIPRSDRGRMIQVRDQDRVGDGFSPVRGAGRDVGIRTIGTPGSGWRRPPGSAASR